MPVSAQCRNDNLTKPVHQTFTLADVRVLATGDPKLLPAASAWAKVYHPRTTLARAV